MRDFVSVFALKLPGRRTGLIYVWVIALGPLLLFAAGLFLLVMGFWRDTESVAAIGAIGIVASLILPRMQGEFEIGAGGIKGALENEIFREMIKKALESGVGAERAIELAAEATGPPGPTGPVSRRHQSRGWFYDSAADAYAFFDAAAAAADPLAATIWVDNLTSQFVGESVGLEHECAEIVQRVADERGWDVRREVRRVGPGGTYVFDFVLTTQTDPILIDAANFRGGPATLAARVADFSGALQDHRFLAAFLVIPNRKAAAAYVPENVHIVPVGDLERKLRELGNA